MDKLDSFNVLLDEEYEIAKTLHQAGESLGCKIVSKKDQTDIELYLTNKAIGKYCSGWRYPIIHYS